MAERQDGSQLREGHSLYLSQEMNEDALPSFFTFEEWAEFNKIPPGTLEYLRCQNAWLHAQCSLLIQQRLEQQVDAVFEDEI